MENARWNAKHEDSGREIDQAICNRHPILANPPVHYGKRNNQKTEKRDEKEYDEDDPLFKAS